MLESEPIMFSKLALLLFSAETACLWGRFCCRNYFWDWSDFHLFAPNRAHFNWSWRFNAKSIFWRVYHSVYNFLDRHVDKSWVLDRNHSSFGLRVPLRLHLKLPLFYTLKKWPKLVFRSKTFSWNSFKIWPKGLLWKYAGLDNKAWNLEFKILNS